MKNITLIMWRGEVRFSEDDVRSGAVVKKAYEDKNYSIEYTGADNNNCLVCFSGNGLYFPNEHDEFYVKIILNDRYEWKSICQAKEIRKQYSKIIFLRDIYKKWYVYGINTKCCSIEKVYELLKKETVGYDVTTVGNSAGGYAAVLFGSMLQARHCFSFSGQFDITNHIDADEQDMISDNAVLNQRIQDYGRNVWYFMPAYCDIDISQYDGVKDLQNVRTFRFAAGEHGSSVINANLKDILTASEEMLGYWCQHYAGKIIHRYRFLLKTEGVIRGIRTLLYVAKRKKK